VRSRCETESCLSSSPCQSFAWQGESLSRSPSVIAKSKATKQSREEHGIATHLSDACNDGKGLGENRSALKKVHFLLQLNAEQWATT
jgi:hypothetical protein